MRRAASLMMLMSLLSAPVGAESIDAFIGEWAGRISGIPVELSISQSAGVPEATASFNRGPAETFRFLGFKDAIPGLYFWREADKAAICLFFERKGLWMAYFEKDTVRKVPLSGLTSALPAAVGLAVKPAKSCSEISQCPSFSEVYRADKVFRDQLLRALRSAQVPKPDWLTNGLAAPMVPLVIGRTSYLIGSVCEPHNCPHQLNVLYSAEQQRVVGQYVPDAGPERWLGSPTPTERKLISESRDAGSSLRVRMEQSSLPVVIE